VKNAATGTPTACSQESFLSPVDPGVSATNNQGGVNCQVAQLAVTGTDVPSGTGWYYDDFSTELKQNCQTNEPQRVAFSPDAKPPTGVVVSLECLNETQTLASTRNDLNLSTPQPGIGSACQSDVPGAPTGDAACIVALANGQADQSMFCHPDLNVCVQSCTGDPQCPPAWVCDTRGKTIAATNGKGAYCVNPTCGVD
jgi:hypothetical protein